MKTMMPGIVFLTFFAACQVMASTETVSALSLHVPMGFDSNDKTEVLVEVELPNTCWRRPFGDVRVFDKTITIDMKAEKLSGMLCIQAVVPVLVSVPVGTLAEGSYEVKVNQNRSSQKEALLEVVSPNSDSIDNHTYANVTNIRKSQDGTTIYLEGIHPSSCMEILEVQLIPNESGDTISVLPIVIQTAPVCEQVTKPFERAISLATTTSNNTVLHIRKLDGNAINFKI